MAQTVVTHPFDNGEMAARIRDHDWTTTPLGPIEQWTPSLRTAVDMVLAMPGPTTILWGPAHVQIYNDAYIAIARDRHPGLLGNPVAEGWADAYAEVIAPLLDAARAGRATRLIGFPVWLDGPKGEPAERLFDTDWSPIRDETGAVAGVLQTLVEVTDQRLAQEALRTSEERFRALATAGSYAVYRMSPDWRRMHQLDGRGFLADTGDASEGWVDAYILPEDRPTVFAAIEAAIREKRMFELEHRVRRGDGSVGWTHSRAVPIPGQYGEIMEWFGAASDVTARKAAETSLHESEDRLLRALEGGEVGAWEIDLITLDAWRSPQHDRIFGYETLLPKWSYDVFLQHVVPEDRGWVDACFQDAVATGELWNFECRIRCADGGLRWIGAQGRIDAGADGRDRRLKGTVRDITDRKNTDAALRESEERFRGLVEGFGQFSWEAAADGLIAVDSLGWRAHTGQSLDQWQGYGWLAAIHPDDRDVTERKWREAVAAGRMVDAEYRLWHAQSGSWRWSNVRAVPITDRAGTIVKWAGVNIDITERRVLQTRQEVLVNELQHRARNLLAVVAAIADRTVRQGGSVEAFEARLQALSRAQGLLSQNGSDRVEVDALVRVELAAYADCMGGRVTMTGPAVWLTSRQVQNFALALHELATNAVKYGALKGADGRLSVTWEVGRDRRERRRLSLDWIESGVPIDPAAPTRTGYGTELIRNALAYTLQATVDYELGADGVRCRIALPII